MFLLYRFSLDNMPFINFCRECNLKEKSSCKTNIENGEEQLAVCNKYNKRTTTSNLYYTLFISTAEIDTCLHVLNYYLIKLKSS